MQKQHVTFTAPGRVGCRVTLRNREIVSADCTCPTAQENTICAHAHRAIAAHLRRQSYDITNDQRINVSNDGELRDQTDWTLSSRDRYLPVITWDVLRPLDIDIRWPAVGQIISQPEIHDQAATMIEEIEEIRGGLARLQHADMLHQLRTMLPALDAFNRRYPGVLDPWSRRYLSAEIASVSETTRYRLMDQQTEVCVEMLVKNLNDEQSSELFRAIQMEALEIAGLEQIEQDAALAELGDLVVANEEQIIHLAAATRRTLVHSMILFLILSPRRQGRRLWMSKNWFGKSIDHVRKTTNDIDDELTRLFAYRDARRPTMTDPGKHFTQQLDQAQIEGLQWLQGLHAAGYGGILADEVGVGKTAQILAHIALLASNGQLQNGALIASPVGGLEHWVAETLDFTAGIEVKLWYGQEQCQVNIEPNKPAIHIVSHGGMARYPWIKERHWSLLAIDEAQDLRNPQSENAMAAMAISAKQKIPVTGTPIENSLLDLWTLMTIANPGLLGTRQEFQYAFVKFISEGSETSRRKLQSYIAPFIISRTKAQAGHHVPPPVIEDTIIDLSLEEQMLYETVDKQSRKNWSNARNTRNVAVNMLEAILQQRQAATHPGLLKRAVGKAWRNRQSSKTQAIIKDAVEAAQDDKRFLIFSNWQELLDIIAPELEARGVRIDRIDGTKSIKSRSYAQQQFKQHRIDGLLITSKSGGRTLNLPEAQCVMIADPWWNPQVEVQAIGRTQRRGQNQVVHVKRYITRNSVEERLIAVQRQKLDIASIISKGNETPQKLTREEMEYILGVSRTD